MRDRKQNKDSNAGGTMVPVNGTIETPMTQTGTEIVLSPDAQARRAAVSTVKRAIDRNPEFAAAAFRMFMQT